MEKWKSFILNTITLVIFVVTFIWILRFLEVDNCLDAGGIFDYKKGICVSPREEFSSLLWRNNFPLWIIISTMSIVPTILIRSIVTKVLNKMYNKMQEPI